MKTAASSHTHDLAEVDAALGELAGRYDAALDALEARIAALEVADPEPPPPDPPPPANTVRVTSIAALLTELANEARDEIVVANGTYRVPGASTPTGKVSGLWIDNRFRRTRPVLVRPDTPGGVTFDGNKARWWIGMAFVGGSCYQTWEGFRLANGEPTGSGAIVFGGYVSTDSWGAGAHHITLRDFRLDRSITSQPTDQKGNHMIYFSQASEGGPHDLLLEDFHIDCAGYVDGALHFYHSTATEANAHDVTMRRMTVVNGPDVGLYLWDKTLRNIVVEDSTLNAKAFGIRYENPGTGVQATLRRVKTVTTSGRGFYSSLGATPPGVVFEDCDLR